MQTVIGVRNAGFARKRLRDDLLSFRSATQPEKDRRQHAVRWNAAALLPHGALGKWQRLDEAPGAHQSICFDIGGQ